jgi:3-oxoadipyl-CoA thiolase
MKASGRNDGATTMKDVFICDALRTPFGRFGGALSSLRADDLAAVPLRALMERHPQLDWAAVDDVIFGCANQAGEDNRNVARMALLLAGLPETVSAVTVNRLCGSSLDAAMSAARAIKSGEAELIIAGGVESMSRAPYVLAKANAAFAREQQLEDTTLGWRLVNPLMQQRYGIDSMPETAENVARECRIGRADQDAYAFRSQQRTAKAQEAGYLRAEITPVRIAQKKGEALIVDSDEHPRPDTRLEKLAALKGIVTPDGTVTAGNASGINDGAAALIIASDAAVKQHRLTPRARIVASTTIGLAPRIMGFAPAPAIKKLLRQSGIKLQEIDTFEINEAFAAQVLTVVRDLGVPDDAEYVNPNGGAIALGHPLGASGARLLIAATNTLQRSGGRYGICSMCIGVGQGIAMLIEHV